MDNEQLNISKHNSQDVAVYILDLIDGAFRYMGMSIFDICGYPPNFFTGSGFNALFEIIVQEDYHRIKDKYANNLWSSKLDYVHKPEVLSDVFRIKTQEGKTIWIENTIVILNYSKSNRPQKALGYMKQVRSDWFVHFKENSKSLQRQIMSTNPPYGLANLSRMKKWPWKKRNQNSDGLLQVAFQGSLNIKLTKREREVLDHIANGFSTKEIANLLFISETTVVTHRKHLLNKFEVKNVAELVKEASKYFHFN